MISLSIVCSLSFISGIRLSKPTSSIYLCYYMSHLLYKGSISYPYVSRFKIEGHETIKLGTMPEEQIGI